MSVKPGGLNLFLRAGIPLSLPIEGRFLACIESEAPFVVAFDGGDAAPMERGITLEDSDGYTEVRFTSQVDQSVRLVRSRGQVFDARTGGTVNATANISDGQVQQIRTPVLDTAARNQVRDAVVAALIAQGVELGTVSAGARADLTAAFIDALRDPDVLADLRAAFAGAIADASPIATTTA